ncbi:MAG: Ig-like domain-containing protein [Candidatus Acidiferrales bacterium]
MHFASKFVSSWVILCSLAFAPVVHAQETGAPPTPPKAASVEVTPTGVQAQVGEKIRFTAVAKNASGKAIDVKPTVWIALPPDIAGADADGNVVFRAAGQVTVGAVVAGKPGFTTATVAPPPPAKVEVEPLTQPLTAGGSTVLTASARSANGDPRTDVAIRWTSKSPAIAKVDQSGLVTAVAPGTATLIATGGPVKGELTVRVVADTVQKIALEPATTTAKTGDVVHFTAKARNAKDSDAGDVLTNWSVSGPRATIYPDGAFVAELPGTYQVIAAIGRHSAVASIAIAPRNAGRELEVVSHIPTKNADGSVIQTTEEWVVGNHLYVATFGDKIFAYDISDASHPKALDTLKADARLYNDVSTTPDEKVGVFTREGASSRKNGIVLFDASDPSHLKVLSEYTETVTGGVHSAFINTHYVYITDDATGSLRIIDFQDPVHPREVARWQTEKSQEQTIASPMGEGMITTGRYLHDLHVKDGLAYLAYWRDGLVILDVGNGIKGGSPEHPKLVAQYKYNHYELYGDHWLAGTHTAFRYKNYVFVGDEVFPGYFDIDSKERIPVRGILHVMDVSDIEHPREVATYEVPEGGMHNVWADNDVLYLGDYAGGGRVVDISGEMRGNLYQQGREIASFWPADPAGYRSNLPFTWGGQPANGLIFFNDINTGIWIVKLGKPKFQGSTTAPPLRDQAKTVASPF